MKFIDVDPSCLGGRIMILMYHFTSNKNILSQGL